MTRTPTRQTTASKIVRFALWMSPVALVAGVFFAAVPWLKDLSDTVVWLVTAAAAVAVLGYSLVIAHRAERSVRGTD